MSTNKKNDEGKKIRDSYNFKIYYEKDNIRDLNLLTVNYLQRQAMVKDRLLFENITDIIKEIKNIITTETENASFFFPIPKEPYIIPEFYVNLFNSKFMSEVLEQSDENDNRFEMNINENRMDISKYHNLKVLLFTISMKGKYAKTFMKEYINEFNFWSSLHNKNKNKIIDDICDLLFNSDLEDFINDKNITDLEDFKKINNITDPNGNYYIKCKVKETFNITYEIVNHNDFNKKISFEKFPKEPFENTRYKKIADVIRMNKNLELIKEFSYKYNRYDAFSLTTYHDIEYYIDRFVLTIHRIKKNGKNEYMKKMSYSPLYDKCLHYSDQRRFVSRNDGTKRTEIYNIYDGSKIYHHSEVNRFIGLLIWDVKYAKKCSINKAINIVMKWLDKKYGAYELKEDEHLIDTSESSMMRAYQTAKYCIDEGAYFIKQDSGSKDKYKRPQLKNELITACYMDRERVEAY